MIAHSGTACVTSSIEWEGVLVGALDWCSEPTLKWGVNPVLVVLRRVIRQKTVFHAILPDGAA
jgi:hypothetical protein